MSDPSASSMLLFLVCSLVALKAMADSMSAKAMAEAGGAGVGGGRRRRPVRCANARRCKASVLSQAARQQMSTPFLARDTGKEEDSQAGDLPCGR